MSAIQDKVLNISALWKFGVHTRNIKYLVYKFKYPQQDAVPKKQNKMIENIIYQGNQYLFTVLNLQVLIPGAVKRDDLCSRNV